ncbi:MULTISPECIES: hypothetical protein [unclassified Amycolatopsis]|uniref:hypothetical protein n=1 Tax=unclassified Amycolatopsis TaxID=2618356 RepID=UPI00106EFD38|nr:MULTISPECIES: hypothetical protein [unclassified Amycolatopsis]
MGELTHPDIDDNYGDTPLQPNDGSISFEISIPERIQTKLNPIAIVSERKIEIGTEFLVQIRYFYHGPVTFVECLNCPPDTKASAAVALVREYLINELDKIGNDIRMVTVGPSPFHADFQIRNPPGNKPVDEDPIEFSRAGGYDQCVYNFYSDDVSSVMAKEAVYRTLGNELSLYYLLTIERQIRAGRMEDVAESLEELTDLHQKKGLRGTLSRLFKSSKVARKLILDVLMAEALESQDKRSSSQSLSTLKERGGRLLYFEKLEEQASVSYLDELRAIKDSAAMLESGRTKEFEVAIVSLSTLLGAAAGAVASLLSK